VAEFVDSDLVVILINQDKHWSVLIGFGCVLGDDDDGGGGGGGGVGADGSTSARGTS
jgi:hypothetical protein